jgi:tRNA(fMet)-specific endonuclease VapC
VILDTNALSGAADGDPGVLQVIGRAERIAVPVIVLGEYGLGVAQSRHRREYEEWLREWVTAVTVLDVDRETTYHYAKIGLELKKIGKPIRSNDLWIAALCGQHALPLLSQDRHFDVVSGLKRLAW